MTGISSEHLFCSNCWEGNTGATHFGLNFLFNKDSCKTKVITLVLVCPILELKLIGLEYIFVVLVDVKTKQVESCYNYLAILSQNRQNISTSFLLVHVNRYAVEKIQIP